MKKLVDVEAGIGKLEGRVVVCERTSAVLHPPFFSRTRCEFCCHCVSAVLPINVLNWQPGDLRCGAGVEAAAAAQITLLPVEIPTLRPSK